MLGCLPRYSPSNVASSLIRCIMANLWLIIRLSFMLNFSLSCRGCHSQCGAAADTALKVTRLEDKDCTSHKRHVQSLSMPFQCSQLSPFMFHHCRLHKKTTWDKSDQVYILYFCFSYHSKRFY